MLLISVDRFLNFPAERLARGAPTSSSLLIPSSPGGLDGQHGRDGPRCSLWLSSLKLRKPNYQRTWVCFAPSLQPLPRIAAAADRPLSRFETLAVAVFAEPLAFLRVRRDQREGHFSGLASIVNSFLQSFLRFSRCRRSRAVFQKILRFPRKFTRLFQPLYGILTGRFSALATLRFRGGAGYIFIRIFRSTLSRAFFAHASRF